VTGPHGGLPGDARRLLADPPVTEKKLLELNVTWPDLPAEHAEMASELRLFVITWDPLELRPPRPPAFATANAQPLELVVYVPCWSLAEMTAGRQSTTAAVLADLALTVVRTAAAHRDAVLSGRYPKLVARHAAPDLLTGLPAGEPAPAGPSPISAVFGLVSPTWDDIGLGAITDIVQQAFGPVDLDRSTVELSAGGTRLGCRACAGERFGFIADLAESRDRMCARHKAEADQVIARRLARAEVSNPDGWGALADASARLGLPHVPGGLATRLADVGESMYEIPEPDELSIRARLVVEAACWFPGRPDDLAVALGEDPGLPNLPDWLVNLVLDLGRAGLGAEAALVGDALAKVDPEQRSLFDGDVPVALAESGMADAARARIAENLARHPDDLWIRIHAGDALTALGDDGGAAEHFRIALEMTERADDFIGRSDVIERMMSGGRLLNRPVPKPSDPARPTPIVRRQQRTVGRKNARRKGRR
jgi:hypothetical protein